MSQSAVEWPLTGGYLPKKDTPYPKTNKKPQRDSRIGTITIKSNLMSARLVSQKLRTVITKKFSNCWEGSELHTRFPNRGIQQSDWESPGNLTQKARGIWLQDFRGLRDTETLVLEGTNKTLCAPRLREKEQWFHRRLKQNYLLALEGFLWWCALAGAHHRDGALEGSGQEWPPLCKPSWKLPITDHRVHQLKGRLRHKNYQGGDNWIKALLSKALFFPPPVPSIRKFAQAS